MESDPAILAGLLADDIDPITALAASVPDQPQQRGQGFRPGLCLLVMIGFAVLVVLVAKLYSIL